MNHRLRADSSRVFLQYAPINGHLRSASVAQGERHKNMIHTNSAYSHTTFTLILFLPFTSSPSTWRRTRLPDLSVFVNTHSPFLCTPASMIQLNPSLGSRHGFSLSCAVSARHTRMAFSSHATTGTLDVILQQRAGGRVGTTCRGYKQDGTGSLRNRPL